MDGHKLLWHPDRVAQWKAGERIAPLHIDMGISTGCNMACTYCYGVLQNRAGYGGNNSNSRYNMPAEAVKRVFDDAKRIGVRSIALIGEGENTLNPALADVVRHGKSIDLDLGLATNGIRMRSEDMPTLLDSLVWIRFNISASSQESFGRIHQVNRFEQVIDNIRSLVEHKRERGSTTTIGMQMVLVKDNVNDVVPLARLGRECGVDYLVVKPCSDTYDGDLDSPTGMYAGLGDLFREAESFATEDYSVIIKWSKLGNEGIKDYPVCFGTQFIIAISGNGDVFPCGHWFNIRRDEFLMGNVVEQGLEAIVKSDRYWEVQERIQKVNVNRDCESNCRQHYVNQFLDQLSNPPDHVNFV
ncbi:radical SAM protein [Endothiovibrio diazotrophicus]